MTRRANDVGPLRLVPELDVELEEAARVLAVRKLVAVPQSELVELRSRSPIPLVEQLRSSIRAMLREEVASLFESGCSAAPSAPAAERRWMTLREYRESRSIAERTLQMYISEGLPTLGERQGRRVVVADADAWLARRMGKTHER